jgi:Coenzyme PQQ synthesis protein D (PqqD)
MTIDDREMSAPIDIDRIFTAASHAVAAPTEVDTIVHHLHSGANYRLDEIGARIWELLETGASIRAIVDAVQKEYALPPDVTSASVQADVIALVAELGRYGLIDDGLPETKDNA